MSSGMIFLPLDGGGSGGDVSGPASSTTNAIARYADTTGKIIKNSLTTISDTGVLTLGSNMGGSGLTNLLIFDQPAAINPVIKWNSVSGDLGLYFVSGSTTVAHIQDNGQLVAGGFQTLNGLNLGDYYVRRGIGAGISMGSTDYGVSVDDNGNTQAFSDAFFKVVNSLASNVAAKIIGAASQTANLLEFRDSTGTLLAYVAADGTYTKV